MYLPNRNPVIHFKPVYWLYLILIAMLIRSVPILLAGRSPNLFWADVVLALMVAGYLIKASLRKNPYPMQMPKVFRWMLLYIVIIVCTLPTSVDILKGIAVSKLFIMPPILFIFTYNFLRKEDDIYHILVGLGLVGLLLAGVALFNWREYHIGVKVLENFYGAKDMVQGISGRSNTVAGISALLTPAALFLIFEKRLVFKLLGIVALTLMMASIVFAMSRGSIIAFGMGILIWLILMAKSTFNRKKLKKISGIVFVIALSLWFVWHVFPEELKNLLLSRFEYAFAFENLETNQRWVRWNISLAYFKDAPLFGIGVGNYLFMMNPLDPMMGGSCHNLYIETLIETGLIGSLAFLGFLIGFGWNLYKLRKMIITDKQLILANCLIMTYIIFLVNVFFEPNYYSVTFTYSFFMMMAMGFAMRRILSQSTANLTPVLKENSNA